jgi:hypothetical protein
MSTITQVGTITGTIIPEGVIIGTICKEVEKIERQTKAVEINQNGVVEVVPDPNTLLEKVIVTTDVIGGDVEEYDGSYEITPKAEEQILPTAYKVMRNDVTVNKIPYAEVTNPAGGTTVIIG